MRKMKTFNEFRMVRTSAENSEVFDKLACAILESGLTYRQWWQTAGLPTLLEMSYANSEEYVDEVLSEAWNNPASWFGGNQQAPQQAQPAAPVDPHAAYKQRGQASLEKLKPQIDQVKQMFAKSLGDVKNQLLQQVSKSPNFKMMYKLVNIIHDNAVKATQSFTPSLAQTPEEAAAGKEKWNNEFGGYQASAANAGLTNAIRNAARYPAQLTRMPPEKISQALQNDKDGSLRQTLMQAVRTAQKSGDAEVAKFITSAMSLSKNNLANANAAVAQQQSQNAQQQSQNAEVQQKQAFIQQIKQKRQERAAKTGTLPVALSPQQLDQMWADHKAKMSGGGAGGNTIPFPGKNMPPVVPAATGTSNMRRENTETTEDIQFIESLVAQSTRRNDFGIMGL